MNNKYMAYGLIFLNVLLQIASCFWYRELPGFVWTLANAILILVPLVFGLKMGLLCLLPVAASELLWFFKLGSHGILEDADFLSDETRAKAVEKLDAIGKHILYPDDWSKYSCEELNFPSKEEGGNYQEALEAITRFKLGKAVENYKQPVDKEKWGEAPHIVNGFYDPQTNGIYIMGAFSRGALYNSEMSDEELYATIGVIIGHEISHAFDSDGAQYDKNGDLRNWWTEGDYARFRERNEKMIAYYNAMHPWEGQDFYGSIMTGEACADMAGVKVMLKIASGNPDFDYDKFFRTYANVWLTKETLQAVYAGINDSHPLPYLRVNATLQQYQEFLDCYGITEGDGMYLASEDRVTIW